MILETPRLRLRPFRSDDIAPYAVLRNDPEVTAGLPGGRAAAATAAADAARLVPAFAALWQTPGYGPWAVEARDTGRLLGHLGLRLLPELDGATELLYLLGRDAWGRGYATEGGRAALGYGFGTLGLPRIIALARPENSRSIAVMQRLGMASDGETIAFGMALVRYRMEAAAWPTRC